MPRFLIPGLAAALAAGCISADVVEGTDIAWESVERIRVGETTRSEVLSWLGAPQNFANPAAFAEFVESGGLEAETGARYPFADVFVYQLSRGRLRGFAALFYNRFELHIDSDLVVILFDESDRVRHFGIRRVPQPR
jgi:hypothetical protein